MAAYKIEIIIMKLKIRLIIYIYFKTTNSDIVKNMLITKNLSGSINYYYTYVDNETYAIYKNNARVSDFWMCPSKLKML